MCLNARRKAIFQCYFFGGKNSEKKRENDQFFVKNTIDLQGARVYNVSVQKK